MGGKCGCCSSDDPNELKIAQIAKECTGYPQTESTAPFALDATKDVLVLQNAIRSYLSVKAVTRESASLVMMMQSDVDELIQPSSPISFVPNLLTDAASSKLRLLKPYEYPLTVIGGDYVGPVMFSDGSVYDGQWKGGRRFGRGKYYSASGGVYEGYWNGGLHLHGRIVYPNGDHYEGEYRHMKRWGMGVFQTGDLANSYRGEWRADLKHGTGEEKISDGTSYSGQFESGLRHGEGRLLFSNGDIYEGFFANNKFNGRGKFTWSSGKSYTGDWKDGQMHGKGTLKSKGKEYTGDFVAGKKEGVGVLVSGNCRYEGEFRSNKRHGKAVVSENGLQPQPCVFANNRRMASLEFM